MIGSEFEQRAIDDNGEPIGFDSRRQNVLSLERPLGEAQMLFTGESGTASYQCLKSEVLISSRHARR